MTPARLIKRVLLWLIVVLFAVYACDYFYLRIRMFRRMPADPFESLTRTRVLAIPQKSGKFDFQIDQTQPVETLTCVHSLFPHYGDQPCWYLKPRLNQPIPVS